MKLCNLLTLKIKLGTKKKKAYIFFHSSVSVLIFYFSEVWV